MKVVLLEPYFTGSHKQWALGLQQHSNFEVEIISLTGHYWKWRMHGGAIALAEQYNNINYTPDLLLATSMVNLPVFLSLTNVQQQGVKTSIYFHENQITYPWSPTDRDVANKRDNNYGFINYTSALAANKVLFNSQYHKQSFLTALPNFLKQFPDNNGLHNVKIIEDKSTVLPLGMDLKRFDAHQHDECEKYGTILWNHRWEYDKNPEQFFNVLYELANRGIKFNLIVLGENFSQQPKIFDEAKEKLQAQIIHFGYADTFEQYAQLLWKADLFPVTSNQDFFGGSVVEAMYCNCVPLLPKRLAYPEHIPAELHQTFFYNDEDDLVNRLQRQLLNLPLIRKQNVQQFVSRYDWGNLGEEYDLALKA